MFDSVFLSAANHLLAQSGWARTRLLPHAGKRARLDLAPFTVDFSVSEDGYFAAWSSAEAPDVTLSLPLGETPRALTGGVEAMMAHVRIDGNAEFADTLGFVFRHLRWDVEDDLARVTGDIAARRIVDGGLALGRAQKRTLTNVVENLAEYLTEEQPMLTPRELASAFGGEVSAFRDAIARLEKRIDRLPRTGPRP